MSGFAIRGRWRCAGLSGRLRLFLQIRAKDLVALGPKGRPVEDLGGGSVRRRVGWRQAAEHREVTLFREAGDMLEPRCP